jgi:hypothetical protein
MEMVFPPWHSGFAASTATWAALPPAFGADTAEGAGASSFLPQAVNPKASTISAGHIIPSRTPLWNWNVMILLLPYKFLIARSLWRVSRYSWAIMLKPPPECQANSGCFFSCGAAAKLHGACGDESMACEYRVQVRVVQVCVVQLRYRMLAN